MEAAAYDYFAKIDELGGMVEAVKRDFPQREIADAAFTLPAGVDDRQRIVVGVNALHRGRRTPLDSCASTPRSSASRSTASKASAPAATPARSRRRSPSSTRPPPATQPDAEPPRRRPRTRHRRRDRRSPPDGLRHLHRDASLLSLPPCPAGGWQTRAAVRYTAAARRRTDARRLCEPEPTSLLPRLRLAIPTARSAA